MKRSFSILSLFLLVSCGGSADFVSSDSELNQLDKKAGADYTIANTFDLSGNLSFKGGSYNLQTLGTPMELWMGVGNANAGTLVGYVTFLSSPDRVRIDLTDADGVAGPDMFPYVVEEAHIHFAPTVADIPHTKKGNPIPGQFEYNVPVDPNQSVIEIPVQFDLVGAIHLSVVKYGGVEGFNFYLPNDPVTLRVIDYPSADDPTYYKIKVTNGGFISTYQDGVYEGWCIDVDHTIALNQDYQAQLFSSYEELPSWLVGPGLIEHPENFDKVNWMLNAYATGDTIQPVTNAVDCAPTGTAEALTYSDIQKAIWHFVDDSQMGSGILNFSQNRVDALICAANAYGDGFVPSCNEKIIFIVAPTGGTITYQLVIGQPVIGSIPVPCETSGGTAWGDGKYGAKFPGASQWGTYFQRQRQPD